ncbi:DUF4157 domain-containing protein [Sphingomonas sp. R-74633]|uniref:eCIS core domain-containing protein n=1 Tax=Sphingomonas sp. R-74633 TaxID=2751188 RepID=UPI0015D3051E|nr:DUF4157 domain-containing protein [Sphingomonas sp. R-74633]NYT43213.1 DUF4157 domain-containing protein [Sphingomonas sp. R-74633]
MTRALPGPPSPAYAGRGAAAQRFGGGNSFEIDAVRLGLARNGGKPLPQAVLAKMEAAFRTDFSAVRVHIGPQAARIGAVAFTTGNDLYFAQGRYQPDSVKGQQLIGHELAHVIQQRQGRVRAPGAGVSVVQDRTLEAEADRLGQRAAMQRMPVQAKAASDAAAFRRHAGIQRRAAPYAGPAPAHLIQRASSSKSEKTEQKKAVVKLTINGDVYEGTSSGQYGHAEMSALRDFILAQGDYNTAAAVLYGGRPTVECHNQPVCGSCSLILRALGFRVADAQTEFSGEPSGGVSWGANMTVQAFLADCNEQATYARALEMGKK